MSIFLRLERSDMERLIKHLCKYRERNKSEGNKSIRMFIPQDSPSGKEEKYSEYSPKYSSNGHLILPERLKIRFRNKDHGISWELKSDTQNDRYSSYIVEAKINPKLLGGTQEYIAAATYDDLQSAIWKFDLMVRDISPLLGTFACYKPNRIDYCVNFALRELAPGCPTDMVMKLIQRADVPSDYEPKTEYSETSHRMEPVKNSYYLECGSTIINCYEKMVELQKRNRKDNGSGPISKEVLEEAQDIIRFEVQCLYPRTRRLCQQVEQVRSQSISIYDIYDHIYDHIHIYGYLFDLRTCLKEVNAHYKNTIGRGDWYTLSEAEKVIKSKHYHSQKSERLLKALQEVSRCRGVAKAKEKIECQGGDLASFNRTLYDLQNIGINPVTIPREWGIVHIPNLMHTFNDIFSSRDICPDSTLI